MSSRESVRRFHFLREIGSGGFGSVFLAKVVHADGFSRLVAVKLLKNQWTESEEIASRMRDEARLLGLIRHRNIVDVLDLTSIDGRVAVIMEYLEGVDLRFVSRRLIANDERLSVRAVLEVGYAVASALDAAYNRPPFAGEKPLRVIHRDIKPNNIMLDETGMTKVLDFGVARSELDTRESHTQELQFGSVEYMAPERLFFEPETPASDVYSMGATLYELMGLEKFGKARGRPERHLSFLDDRIRALSGKLKLRGLAESELASLLRDCLSFSFESRPSASEVSQRCRALARLIDDEDLQSWSERMIPDMFRTSQEIRRDPNPLVETTVTEDSVLVRLSESRADLAALEKSVDDSEALRRGALADLTRSGDLEPTPASGSPARMVDVDPPTDWDDGPTNVEFIPDGGLDGVLDVPTIPPLDETMLAGVDPTEVMSRSQVDSPRTLSTTLPGHELPTMGKIPASVLGSEAETPTEVVDATRLLQLAAELQIEESTESTGELTDSLERTGPLMGLDHAELPTTDSIEVPPPPEPSPRLETPEDVEDGSSGVVWPPVRRRTAATFLRVGFGVLLLAIVVLIMVIFAFREPLAMEMSRRGWEVPGFDSAKSSRNKDADDDERDEDEDDSRDEDDEDDEDDEEGEADEETESDGGSSDLSSTDGSDSTKAEGGSGPSDPADAPGVVFSFPEHEAQGLQTIRIACDDHGEVRGSWWAHLEIETASECKVKAFPDRQRVTMENLSAGHYVCTLDPELACELEQ